MAEDLIITTVTLITCLRSCVTIIIAIVALAILSCIFGIVCYYIRARAKARERERKRDQIERVQLAQTIRETLSRNWSRNINSLDEEESIIGV